MAQVINTNIMSLNAQRNLSMSQTSLATAMQRLSSGLRINSAKDDAAGLAISERFTTQIRGLNQAVRNANDGISLAQTAEGALGTISDNLQRIRELAIQSANATNNDSDRAALDLEVQQRLSEIDRVASQTSFNSQKILDGTFGSAAFQVGANVGETIALDLQANMRTNDTLGAIATATSGDLDAVFAQTVTGSAVAAAAALAAGELTINGTGIAATATAGSAEEMAASINAASGTTGVTATTANSTTGSLGAFTTTAGGTYSFTIEGVQIVNAAAAGLTAANFDTALGTAAAALTAAGVSYTGTAAAGTLTFTKADGTDINITEAWGAGGTAGGFAALTDPTAGNSVNTMKSGATISLTSATDPIVIAGTAPGDAGFTAGTYGSLVLAAGEMSIQVGSNTAVAITGTFNTAQDLANHINTNVEGAHASVDTAGKLVLQSTEAITLSGTEATDTVVAEGTASGLGFSSLTNAVAGNLSTVNIATVAAANDAILRIDNALKSVNDLRSTFGAIQNRFESTITNLTTSSENLTASRSRIMDADFAQETAALSRAQILQQAGTAMIAQANQVPQGVLQLLQG
jgi:flagellin